jgi:hypothetical protein
MLCRHKSFPFSLAAIFAAGEKVRMRGKRRLRQIHPPAGRDERLNCLAKALGERCIRTPHPASPKNHAMILGRGENRMAAAFGLPVLCARYYHRLGGAMLQARHAQKIILCPVKRRVNLKAILAV